MSPSQARLTSALVGLSLLAGCPSPNRSVDSSKSSAPEDAGAAVADTAPSPGPYLCRWRKGEIDLDLPCEIRREGDKKTLSLIAGESSLQGIATPTSFGFRFVGSFQSKGGEGEQSLASDFFMQGPDSYAAVLRLQDKTHAKLDMRRK